MTDDELHRIAGVVGEVVERRLAEVATKGDIAAIRAEMATKTDIATIHTRLDHLAAVTADTAAQVRALRSALK